MKKIAVVLLMISATFVAPGAADAAEPEKTDFTFSNESVFEGFCDGVDLAIASDVIFDITTFSDRDGVPVRALTHADLGLVVTRADTGNTLSFDSVYLVRRDLVTGERAFSGRLNSANFPGAGAVYLDVGRRVFDGDNDLLFTAGPNPDESLLDFACTFLG